MQDIEEMRECGNEGMEEFIYDLMIDYLQFFLYFPFATLNHMLFLPFQRIKTLKKFIG